MEILIYRTCNRWLDRLECVRLLASSLKYAIKVCHFDEKMTHSWQVEKAVPAVCASLCRSPFGIHEPA